MGELRGCFAWEREAMRGAENVLLLVSSLG